MRPRSFFPLLLSFSLLSLAADQIQFQRVKPEIIERRLEKATRNNGDRLRLIKDMFAESGCQVEEQHVRGSKLPNLICKLAGSSASTIVVGAHYDCTGGGIGAIDNWRIPAADTL